MNVSLLCASLLLLGCVAHADKVLYGVPKVAYGPEGVTPFPMCVRACDQFLGGNTSYDFVMAASGAAFRLTWDTTSWNGGNVDAVWTYDDPRKIFKAGFAAVGRACEILERTDATTKDEFFAFIKTQVDLGNPCIALGIIGPPEACIVAGYLDNGEALSGWNFFQGFWPVPRPIETDHNGYFITRDWWENKDTQAVMSFAKQSESIPSFAQIITNAVEVLSPRRSGLYAKGLLAYDAWRKVIFDDTEFPEDIGKASLDERMMCQGDAMDCLVDGRHNAAKFFKNAAHQQPERAEQLNAIAAHFEQTRDAVMKMVELLGGWQRGEEQTRRFADSEVRRQLCVLIDQAKAADTKALEAMKQLVNE